MDEEQLLPAEEQAKPFNIFEKIMFSAATTSFEEQMDSFKWRNILFGGWHATMLLIIIIVFNVRDISDFYTVETKAVLWQGECAQYGALMPVLNPTLATDVCASVPSCFNISWGSSPTYKMEPRVEEVSWLSKKLVVYIFLGVTVAGHFYRVLKVNELQFSFWNALPRVDRWFEYSFSSSSMLVVIASTSGVLDIWLLWTLAFLQSGLVMYAVGIEALSFLDYWIGEYQTEIPRGEGREFQEAQSVVHGGDDHWQEYWDQRQNDMDARIKISQIRVPWKVGQQPISATWFNRGNKVAPFDDGDNKKQTASLTQLLSLNTDMVRARIVKWKNLFLYVSSGMLLWGWLVIGFAFLRMTSTYSCAVNESLWSVQKIPYFVFLSQFFLFVSFGGLEFFRFFTVKQVVTNSGDTAEGPIDTPDRMDPLKAREMRYLYVFQTEFFFDWLSLTAKTVLTILIFIGALSSNLTKL